MTFRGETVGTNAHNYSQIVWSALIRGVASFHGSYSIYVIVNSLFLKCVPSLILCFLTFGLFFGVLLALVWFDVRLLLSCSATTSEWLSPLLSLLGDPAPPLRDDDLSWTMTPKRVFSWDDFGSGCPGNDL